MEIPERRKDFLQSERLKGFIVQRARFRPPAALRRHEEDLQKRKGISATLNINIHL